MIITNIPLSDLTKPAVLQLQQRLKDLNYYFDKVDGIVGKNTNYAFAEWKEDNWLDQHTMIGPSSWKLLESQAEKAEAAIDWSNFSSPVSKYFTVKEVTNGERRRIPADLTIRANVLRLAAELDKVRADWGSKIGVTSWYRPLAINRAIGSGDRSQHVLGLAADIYPMEQDIFKFQAWLDARWKMALGYGAKKGFVHVDLRHGRIRWNY
jgi:hypothetical protein